MRKRQLPEARNEARTGPGMASHHRSPQKNVLTGRAERSWPKPQPRRRAATSLSAAAAEEPTDSFCMRVFNFELNIIIIKSWRSAEFAQIVMQRTEPLFLRPESLKHQAKSTGSIIGQLVLLRPEPELGPICRTQGQIRVQKLSLLGNRVRYTEVSQKQTTVSKT